MLSINKPALLRMIINFSNDLINLRALFKEINFKVYLPEFPDEMLVSRVNLTQNEIGMAALVKFDWVDYKTCEYTTDGMYLYSSLSTVRYENEGYIRVVKLVALK